MALTPSKIALVRASMARIAARPEQAALVFCTSLHGFTSNQRPAWTAEVRDQATALIGTLSTVVDLLDTPEAMQPILADLAMSYRDAGLTPRGYVAIHAALSEMVSDDIGACDEAAQDAWGDAIDLILWIMLHSAHGPRSYGRVLPMAA